MADPRRIDWDALATRYESQLLLERRPLDAALALAAPGSDERLLDVATGTGELLHRLAAAGIAPARVVGVDSSATMLEQVPPLPGGWETVLGDARELPFAAGSFDVVACAYLLHLLEPVGREAVLAEIRRVLVARGRAVFVTPSYGGARIDGWLRSRLEPRLGGAARGLLALDPRPELRTAGLRVTATRRVWLGYPSLCVLAQMG